MWGKGVSNTRSQESTKPGPGTLGQTKDMLKADLNKGRKGLAVWKEKGSREEGKGNVVFTVVHVGKIAY